MKTLKFGLLMVGILGTVFSIYGLLKGSDTTASLMGLICSACVFFGYFEVTRSSHLSRS